MSNATTTSTRERDDHPWTDDEKQAVLDVREILVNEKGIDPSTLSEHELVYITITCKCRVDEAVTKFMNYHENILVKFGVTDFMAELDDGDGDIDGDGADAIVNGTEQLAIDDPAAAAADYDPWSRFAAAGTDVHGRQILWIIARPGGTAVEHEASHMRTCLLYTIAAHADRHVLRNGIVVVVDLTDKGAKVGNEKRLQVAYQTVPSRPKTIYIVGTTAAKRVAVNALIAFASLFTKSKVIERVRFATVEMVEEDVGVAALPGVRGGEKRTDGWEWAKERLKNFPTMNLPPITATPKASIDPITPIDPIVP